MRACDTFQSFPSIILVLAIVNLVGPLGVEHHPGHWRPGVGLGGPAGVQRHSQRQKAEYVEASRVLGATDRDILFRTILPNVVSPVWAALPPEGGAGHPVGVQPELSGGWACAHRRPPGEHGPVRHGAGEPHHPSLGVDPAGAVHCGHRAGPAAGGGRGCGGP